MYFLLLWAVLFPFHGFSDITDDFFGTYQLLQNQQTSDHEYNCWDTIKLFPGQEEKSVSVIMQKPGHTTVQKISRINQGEMTKINPTLNVAWKITAVFSHNPNGDLILKSTFKAEDGACERSTVFTLSADEGVLHYENKSCAPQNYDYNCKYKK